LKAATKAAGDALCIPNRTEDSENTTPLPAPAGSDDRPQPDSHANPCQTVPWPPFDRVSRPVRGSASTLNTAQIFGAPPRSDLAKKPQEASIAEGNLAEFPIFVLTNHEARPKALEAYSKTINLGTDVVDGVARP
jgi:hypothetical protein